MTGSDAAGPVQVAGFLGAGKSRLIRDLGLTDAIEVPGLAVPAPPGPVITVADAANWADLMADHLTAPLVEAQIRQADLVIVSRTDLVDATAVMAALRAMTKARLLCGPLTEGHVKGDGAETGAKTGTETGAETGAAAEVPSTHGADTDAAGLVRDLAARPGAAKPHDQRSADLHDRYLTWTYAGAATFRTSSAEALAEDRPPGLYRLSGTLRTDRGGLAIERSGKVRETRPVPEVAETNLVAWARKDRTDRQSLDFWFAEHAAAAAHRAGWFGYR